MTELERAVERSIEYAVFGGSHGRREFIARVGAATASAALGQVFPVAAAKALAQDKPLIGIVSISATEANNARYIQGATKAADELGF